MVIGRRNRGLNSAFTVRKISHGVGVERSFQAHSPMIDSQALWDATMAYSISQLFSSKSKPLIVHLNGSFHTEKRLGMPEHLQRYRPGAKFLVVTMKYVDDVSRFDLLKHLDLGDYVVLTDSAAPRSKR